VTHDNTHDWLIVVPTVADPDVLPVSFRRLLRHLSGACHVVLSVNPVNQGRAEECMAMVEGLIRQARDQGHTVTVERADGPLGFARAVNSGLAAAGSVAPYTLILNDDVHVTSGFLQGLEAAFETEHITLSGEPAGNDGQKPRHPVEGYGRIGAVGPCSDVVAGLQSVPLKREQRQAVRQDLDRWAFGFRQRNPGNVLACDFLSGFALALRREALVAMLEDGALFSEDFGIGGYEDNDLCVRLDAAGWRLAIAGDTFVGHLGHQTLDRYFPGQKRGTHIENRLAYYRRWEHVTQAPQRVVAVYRFGPTFVHDLHLMRLSVEKAATLVDGIAVLLTRNPLETLQQWDRDLIRSLPEADRALLQTMNGADEVTSTIALTTWLESMTTNADAREVDVRVQVWPHDFNERDERNASIELGESMGADWVWSIDHDEVVEPRVTRRHVDRVLSHPDPLVRSWDFGWCNHWDTPNKCRVDRPWGDGTTYTGGMRGFRLWRVNKAAPRRILAGNAIGLHCGNSPDHDPLAKRVAAWRFRHFGYLRPQDRQIKADRYRSIDPNPNQRLTGGGYGHLVNEEGMQVSPYLPSNGIGFTMMTYEQEAPEDLARWLDTAHGLADRAVIVWTGDPDEIPEEVTETCEWFGAEVLLHRYEGSLADCRNAGLSALREYTDEGVAWMWTMDPDEALEDQWSASLSLRRMAECTSTYGFLVRFRNFRPPDSGEPPTTSETLRFVRLDPEGVMRWSGRVHEGFMESLMELGAQAGLLTAPWWAHNTGLMRDDMLTEQKLRKYQGALLAELEEHPDNAAAWVSLGLQYENDGAVYQAEQCFANAIATGHPGYLGHSELMMHYLRRAKALSGQVMRRVPRSAARRDYFGTVAKWMHESVGEFPLSGMARRGPVDPEKIPPVPEFQVPGGEAPDGA